MFTRQQWSTMIFFCTWPWSPHDPKQTKSESNGLTKHWQIISSQQWGYQFVIFVKLMFSRSIMISSFSLANFLGLVWLIFQHCSETTLIEQYSLCRNINTETDGGRLFASAFYRLVCILAIQMKTGVSHNFVIFTPIGAQYVRDLFFTALIVFHNWNGLLLHKTSQMPFPSWKCFWLLLGKRPKINMACS